MWKKCEHWRHRQADENTYRDVYNGEVWKSLFVGTTETSCHCQEALD